MHTGSHQRKVEKETHLRYVLAALAVGVPAVVSAGASAASAAPVTSAAAAAPAMAAVVHATAAAAVVAAVDAGC